VLRVVAAHFHAVLGSGVIGAAGFGEGAEFHGVAGQGAMGGLGYATLQVLKGAIEPDGDTVVGDQIDIGFALEGTSTKCDDVGAASGDVLDPFAENFGFDVAELGFAAGFKDLRNADTFAALYFLIQIYEGPAQVFGKGMTYGGFSASHKSDQEDAGGSFQF
jgi:hypothetical protein